jgi:hypothetical protein
MRAGTKTEPRVSRQDIIDALRYFHGIGMIENLHGDEAHYCRILMQFAAMRCGITLDQNKL